MLRNALYASVALVAMGGGGVAVAPMRDQIRPESGPIVPDADKSQASATVIGQFRTSLASWLWVRTDLYLHNGVEMRPMTQAEASRSEQLEEHEHEHGGGDEHEHEHEHDHDHELDLHGHELVTTVIPPAERDFRGIFGDLERATKAYQDMRHHDHHDPKSALPLFRLMTWIEPQFIRAWTTGASIMAWGHNPGGTDRALGFLAEAQRKNPRSIAIEMEIGSLTARKKGDLQAAVRNFERARQLGLEQWDRLDEEEREALLDNYRWLALAYRELGKLDRTCTVSEEGLARFPDDAVLNRLRHPRPSPLLPDHPPGARSNP